MTKRILYIMLVAQLFVGVLQAQKPVQNRRQAAGQSMERQGLVNVKAVVPSIKVALMYARTDNFCHRMLYHDLRDAYVLPACADALRKAQAELKRRRPDLSLCIFDATRPMSVQQTMWDAVKNTPQYFYVSNPAHGGGMHNYGMAVDISICKASWNDASWREGAAKCHIDTIPMGVKVDHMGVESHIDKEQELVSRGMISREALNNRRLLREVMRTAGFMPLRTEWWHFNLCTREWAKKNLKVVR
ncbi:M15 family metallopeptidase [Prevotella histicola]|uniref:M15 family metallopeptidase n=1 Tax=Prevotella histicola TaxID=470565 RepID=UPI001CB23136|nr:M15 family metallopeptidase [Prevotella histicola]MBF1399927.1 M15 family metallopeptidase [Prevotella histicola]